MGAACGNLSVGEAVGHPVRQGDLGRCLLCGCLGWVLAQLPILVAAPGVSVPVAGHAYREADDAGLLASGADLVETDASAVTGRSDRRLLTAQHVALARVDRPVRVNRRPVCDQTDAGSNGLAEVIGYIGIFFGVLEEPAVETITVPGRIRIGARSLTAIADGLRKRCVSTLRITVNNRMRRPNVGVVKLSWCLVDATKSPVDGDVEGSRCMGWRGGSPSAVGFAGRSVADSFSELDSGDLQRGGVKHGGHGCRAVACCRDVGVAELAVVVLAPGVGVAVLADGQGVIMGCADADGFESLACIVRTSHFYRGCLLVASAATAGLPIVVPAPAPGVAVLVDGQGMPCAGADAGSLEVLVGVVGISNRCC